MKLTIATQMAVNETKNLIESKKKIFDYFDQSGKLSHEFLNSMRKNISVQMKLKSKLSKIKYVFASKNTKFEFEVEIEIDENFIIDFNETYFNLILEVSKLIPESTGISPKLKALIDLLKTAAKDLKPNKISHSYNEE